MCIGLFVRVGFLWVPRVFGVGGLVDLGGFSCVTDLVIFSFSRQFRGG